MSNLKFSNYTKTHKFLKLSDFTNLKKGDKLHLAVYWFGDNSFHKFIYTFNHIEEPTSARLKRHIKKLIYGTSKYTGTAPLWVSKQNNRIKFSISSDESPVFLDRKRERRKSIKPTRPSPSQSATLFNIGTKRKGNDGNIWIVMKTVNGDKRWKKKLII